MLKTFQLKNVHFFIRIPKNFHKNLIFETFSKFFLYFKVSENFLKKTIPLLHYDFLNTCGPIFVLFEYGMDSYTMQPIV